MLGNVEEYLQFDVSQCEEDFKDFEKTDAVKFFIDRHPSVETAMCRLWTTFSLLDMMYEMEGFENVEYLTVKVLREFDVQADEMCAQQNV